MKKYFTKFFDVIWADKKKRIIFIALSVFVIALIVARVAVSVNFLKSETKLKTAAQNLAKKGDKYEKTIENYLDAVDSVAQNNKKDEAATKVGLNSAGTDVVIENSGDNPGEYAETGGENSNETGGWEWTGINGKECDGMGHYNICPNYREVFGSHLSDAQINDWISRHPSGIYDNSEGWVVNTPYPDQPISSPDLLALVEDTSDKIARGELSTKEATAIIENSYGGTVWLNLNPRNMGQVFKDVSSRMLVDGHVFDFCYNYPVEETSFIKHYVRYNQSEDTAEVLIVTISLA